MTQWFRDLVPVTAIVKETENAVLFKITESGYAGFTFWFPKKFVVNLLNKTKERKVYYPETFRVNATNGKETINILAGVAFSAILTPHLHPVCKESREVRDLIGY